MTSKKAIQLIEKYGHFNFVLGSVFAEPADGNNMVLAFRALYDYIGGLESRVEDLEDEKRWIPVKLMTPEYSMHIVRYDVAVKGSPYAVTAVYNNHKWFAYTGGNKVDITNLVTHWKERPLPPDESDTEQSLEQQKEQE